LSSGNQGILFPSVSTGKTTIPGKGVGDGITVAVAVAVGSGVNIGGIGEGISVGGTDVETTPQPNEAVSSASTRKTNPIVFFMTLSPFDLIAQRSA